MRLTTRDRAPRVPAHADPTGELRTTPGAPDDAAADDEAEEASERLARELQEREYSEEAPQTLWVV